MTNSCGSFLLSGTIPSPYAHMRRLPSCRAASLSPIPRALLGLRQVFMECNRLVLLRAPLVSGACNPSRSPRPCSVQYSAQIPASQVFIQWLSDSAVTDWGWKMTITAEHTDAASIITPPARLEQRLARAYNLLYEQASGTPLCRYFFRWPSGVSRERYRCFSSRLFTGTVVARETYITYTFPVPACLYVGPTGRFRPSCQTLAGRLYIIFSQLSLNTRPCAFGYLFPPLPLNSLAEVSIQTPGNGVCLVSLQTRDDKLRRRAC